MVLKAHKDILVLVQDGVLKALKVTKVFNPLGIEVIKEPKVIKVDLKVLKDTMVLIV